MSRHFTAALLLVALLYIVGFVMVDQPLGMLLMGIGLGLSLALAWTTGADG